MVTTFEMGRSCNAPIRNVGVSCIEVIPKEKIAASTGQTSGIRKIEDIDGILKC